MAKLIKEIPWPHDCHAELFRDLAQLRLFPGSIAECSCGKRFGMADDQRDGPYWSEIRDASPVEGGEVSA